MAAVADLAAPHFNGVAITDPTLVKIWCVFERPKYARKVRKRDNMPTHATTWLKHTAKPDADNIAKALLDSLRTWIDDRYIWDLSVEKNYGRLLKRVDGSWFAEPSSVHVQVMVVRDNEQKIQAARYVAPRWTNVDNDSCPVIRPALDDLVPFGVPICGDE